MVSTAHRCPSALALTIEIKNAEKKKVTFSFFLFKAGVLSIASAQRTNSREVYLGPTCLTWRMYYVLFSRTKVDSGQALSLAQVVLLAVGEEECPEGLGRLCPCCLLLSMGSTFLHPDTCWNKPPHSCELVGDIPQFLRFPSMYQILGPWELSAKLCLYVWGLSIC